MENPAVGVVEKGGMARIIERIENLEHTTAHHESWLSSPNSSW
jgi:hypothetical protein